ncbi:MAG: hypothetical protein IJX46_01235 [Clostridia bacterium]|nr:hypothetical protein [Clostridia bacterium]
MKKIALILAMLMAVACLFSCSTPTGGGETTQAVKEGNSLKFTDNIAELSAINFSLDIPEKDLLAEEGVVLATYNTKDGANEIIDSLGGMCDLEKFDTEKKGTYILVLVTLGEGKAAAYEVTDIYMNTRGGVPNIDIFVETAGSNENAEATYQYHMLEVESAYINQKLSVFLDGVEITK